MRHTFVLKLSVFFLLILGFKVQSQKFDNWQDYGRNGILFKSIYNGHFENIDNDLYFKMLFLSYVDRMSTTCKEYLPKNRIVKEFEMTVYESSYSGSIVTGNKSLPVMDTYYNKEEKKKMVRVYRDPRFEEKTEEYASVDLAQELVKIAISDYERVGNYAVAELAFFKLLGCAGENRVRFGENLLRFANNQKPYAQEARAKPKVKNNVVVNPLEENEIKVPFAIVEQPPIFPGCENLSKSETKGCFSKKIGQHVKENYYYPQELRDKGISGRVMVGFVISKDGTVKNIKARGPNDQLEEIGRKIMEGLPKMKPASQRGKTVNVDYMVPLTFR